MQTYVYKLGFAGSFVSINGFTEKSILIRPPWIVDAGGECMTESGFLLFILASSILVVTDP
jgi:hypothetical protein